MTKLSMQKHRWLRLGLGTILVILLGAAVWLAGWFHGVKQQQRAVAMLRQLGGRVV